MILKILLSIIILNGLIMPQDLNFSRNLYSNYDKFKDLSLDNRRFKHSDLIPLIDQYKGNNKFVISKKGVSAEGRDIYLIKLGSGKTKVFLWSQMHGDEPTATMAIMDMMRFFGESGPFEEIKETMLSNLSIYIMPLVNPDGAEVYKRRNAFDIDINRDAVRQATPEGILLRTTFEEIKPDFGFNLHDQSPRYSAGISAKPATISFLAPAYNYEKEVNDVRKNAMSVIGVMHRALSEFIPGGIARYSDDFEPRAFGDNFQKWGMSTILIESGGWKSDSEKQFIRQLNFVAILAALGSIADNSYSDLSTEVYNSIPFNERYLFDLLLRNLSTERNNINYKVDIGINLNEINISGGKGYFVRGVVEDLGDLSTFYGYEELDLEGMTIHDGAILDTSITSIDQIVGFDFVNLYSRGYTGIYIDSDKSSSRFTEYPFNIYLKRTYNPDNYVELGETANYIIKENGKARYAIINGFLVDLSTNSGNVENALIFR